MNSFLPFVENFSAGLSELHYTCPEDNSDGKFFDNFLSSLKFFRTLSGRFSPVYRNYFIGFSKLHSTCPEEGPEEKLCEVLFGSPFFIFSEKVLVFYQTISGRVVRSALSLSEDKL